MKQHVIVNKRGAERVRRNNHLWIYRSDITDTADITGGSIVRVNPQMIVAAHALRSALVNDNVLFHFIVRAIKTDERRRTLIYPD